MVVRSPCALSPSRNYGADQLEFQLQAAQIDISCEFFSDSPYARGGSLTFASLILHSQTWQSGSIPIDDVKLTPYGLEISLQRCDGGGQCDTISISAYFPPELDLERQEPSKTTDWDRCIIVWTMMPPSSEGKNPELIDELAKDAQKWAEFRSSLQAQVHKANDFAREYGQRYNKIQISKDTQQVIEEFESGVNDRLNELDQTVRDLLQIVSSLTIPTFRASLSSYTGVCLSLAHRDQNLDQLGAESHDPDVYQLLLCFPLAFCAVRLLWVCSLYPGHRAVQNRCPYRESIN